VTEGIRIRQPLATLTVVSHDSEVRQAVDQHRELVADELNVKSVVTSSDEGSLAVVTARPNYRTLGPRFGARMTEAAAAIEGIDPATLSRILGGETIEILGVSLGAADVVVARVPNPGVAVASGERLSIALDTTITPELAREALAREIVKLVQGQRKDAGLDVSDRITLTWDSASSAVAAAFQHHAEWIAAEVLAENVTRGEAGEPQDAAGEPVTLSVRKSTADSP
jgi:isoleucyl-tRNA synthetase